MRTAHQSRPADVGVMVSRTVLSIVRILIASYFLATATGLIFDPASRTFLDAVLPQAQAQFITTTYLFLTSFAIMVGVFVRPCALLLAVYMFWSGFLHYDLGDPVALAAFWRDMALLGAVLMIALTEQGGGAQVRVWRRAVAPRRVASARHEPRLHRSTPRLQAGGTETGEARLKGVAHASGEIDIYECEDLDDDEDDDTVNIFRHNWDEKPETAATA